LQTQEAVVIQKFTDHARKAMALANEEAMRFGHELIHTEDILLGIIKGDQNVGVNVLKNLDVDVDAIRAEVERRLAENLPPTAHATKLLELAMEEARHLGHNYIGIEHLLLAILDDTRSIAAQVLGSVNVTAERARREIMNLFGMFETADLDQLASPAAWEQQPPGERCRCAIGAAMLALEYAHNFATVQDKPELAEQLRSHIERLRGIQSSLEF
jgi:ATP-dependent Clp protease ATP-binding subunit ClpC